MRPFDVFAIDNHFAMFALPDVMHDQWNSMSSIALCVFVSVSFRCCCFVFVLQKYANMKVFSGMSLFSYDVLYCALCCFRSSACHASSMELNVFKCAMFFGVCAIHMLQFGFLSSEIFKHESVFRNVSVLV